MISCYKIPISRFFFPYLSGIIACDLLETELKLYLSLFISLVVLLAVIAKKTSWQWMLASISCWLLGLYSYPPISNECLPSQDQATDNLQGEIIVCDIKKQNDLQFNFVTIINDNKYMVYLKKNNVHYLPGDTLIPEKLSINLFNPTSVEQNDYEKYLLNQEIKGQIFLTQAEIMRTKKSGEITRFPYQFRQELIQNIQREQVFSALQEGVFYSLLLGERSYLDNTVKNEFKESGIFHVLAISGLHVGILFVFIQSLLKFMRVRNKHTKLIIVVVTMSSYALVAGLSPSVVRAGLMCMLIQLGFFLQKKNITMNIVLTSALILLLIYPKWIWNLGFLLSYLAVIFIVLILENKTKNLTYPLPINKVLQLCKVNIAAFLGTTPILLHNFNVVYLGSMLSSLVIVPLVSLLVSLGLCTMLFNQVSMIFHPLLKLNKLLIILLLKGAHLFSKYASFPLTMDLNQVQCLLMYLLFLTLAIQQINMLNKMKIIATLTLCATISTFYS